MMRNIFGDEFFDMGHAPFNEQHKEMSPLRNRIVHQLGGCADLPAHHQDDERLAMHIFTLSEELGRGHCNGDCPLTFLNTWITGPIMKVDKKFRKFFPDKRTE